MSTESLTPLFKTEVARGAREALHKIHLEHEISPIPHANYRYHIVSHGLDVSRRALSLLVPIMQEDPTLVSLRDLYDGYLVGIEHDAVKDSLEEEVLDGGLVKVTRRGFSPRDEEKSAHHMVGFMIAANSLHNQEIFTDQDMKKGSEAIMATVPIYLAELGTVIQPNINEDSSILARAIAFGDINGALLEGPGVALNDTDRLFEENNLDIFDAMQNPETVSPELWDFYYRRIIDWTQSQFSFIRGRQRLLDREIGWFPGNVQSIVRRQFKGIDGSIAAMEWLVSKRRAQTPKELVGEVFRVKI